MDLSSKKELEIYATKIRMGIIEGTYNAKAGHPGGSLSSADLFAYLYDKEADIEYECDFKVDGDITPLLNLKEIRRYWFMKVKEFLDLFKER